MTQIETALRARSLPVRSIRLHKVNEFISDHSFLCDCDMCISYEPKKVKELMASQEQLRKQKVEEKLESDPNVTVRQYEWVINHLMMPQKRSIVRSLDVFIPEIVFFQNGEPSAFYCTKQIEDATIKSISKGKIHTSVVQKIFTDKRRKYKDYMRERTKFQIRLSFMEDRKEVKHDDKNIIAIRYNDGCEVLGTEKDFGNLLLKKKNGKKVSFIKNQKQFVGQSKWIINSYKHGEHLYEELFQRAKRLIKIYGDFIHEGQKEYISDKEQRQFCRQIIKKQMKIFGQYTLYKIVNYIAYFYDIRIQNIEVKFFVNAKNQIFLDKVFQLQTKQLFPFEWNDEKYQKRIKDEEYKVFYAKKISETQELKEKAKTIEINMQKIYSSARKRYGPIPKEQNVDEKKNNQLFSKLYPDFKYELCTILQDPQMTVQRFRKEYLKQKPKKKSVVTPFNSIMVSTLHKVTPSLKRADPHQFISQRRAKTARSSARNRTVSKTQNSVNLNKTYNSRQI